jgi:hypothetical protein
MGIGCCPRTWISHTRAAELSFRKRIRNGQGPKIAWNTRTPTLFSRVPYQSREGLFDLSLDWYSATRHCSQLIRPYYRRRVYREGLPQRFRWVNHSTSSISLFDLIDLFSEVDLNFLPRSERKDMIVEATLPSSNASKKLRSSFTTIAPEFRVRRDYFERVYSWDLDVQILLVNMALFILPLRVALQLFTFQQTTPATR